MYGYIFHGRGGESQWVCLFVQYLESTFANNFVHFMRQSISPSVRDLRLLPFHSGMPNRGNIREGGIGGSGKQDDDRCKLQQVSPDGAVLPARGRPRADREKVGLVVEACSASLQIASRWSARRRKSRGYHQPNTCRGQQLAACNGCGHWQGAGAFNGTYARGKYSRRREFCCKLLSAATPLPPIYFKT